MRISDWSSDVCSSDLCPAMPSRLSDAKAPTTSSSLAPVPPRISERFGFAPRGNFSEMPELSSRAEKRAGPTRSSRSTSSEQNTSELQSLMIQSYADFILKKKNKPNSNKLHKDNT